MAFYKDYFNIDERYFSTINAELIDSGEVDWTKFYPHDEDDIIPLIENEELQTKLSS